MCAYPLFVPDRNPEYFNRRAAIWSTQEAKTYFEWLTTASEGRIAHLLGFLNVPQDLSEKKMLRSVAEGIAEKIKSPYFVRPGSPKDLTNRGDSLAADVGLLWAELLISKYPSKLRFEILRKPKNHVNYNLPVIPGFVADMALNPVQNAINRISNFAAGQRSIGDLAVGFNDWISYIPA